MNKRQFIVTLSEHFGGDRRFAAKALEVVVETITRELVNGGKVSIAGFGSFETRRVDARWAPDPRAGSRVRTDVTAVRFTAGAKFKNLVAATPSSLSTPPRHPARTLPTGRCFGYACRVVRTQQSRLREAGC